MKGAPCAFPFRLHDGTNHTACTFVGADDGLPWCSTRVDADGRHVRGQWGHCAAACPTERSPSEPVPSPSGDPEGGDYLPGIAGGDCSLTGGLGSAFVVGGQDSKVFEFPFAALVGFRYRAFAERGLFYTCGGTLINKKYDFFYVVAVAAPFNPE